MNRPEDSGQSSADVSAGGFAFPLTPPSSFGPKTIVNPEHRAVSSPPNPLSPGSPASLPRSDLWNSLFPPEMPDGEQSEIIAAGVQLEHFEIIKRVGVGGMGAVFQAIDQRLKRTVAVKILSPSQCRDQTVVQRFENEARAAAQLDHDNIARVYYFGEDQGLYFIAYEFVLGENLRDTIYEHGPLSPAEAVNYTLQMAAALYHMSRAGVVHRDIKPSNIILSPNGQAKLVDLGLARKQATESVGELTMAGTTLGTFDYISPEQAKDPRNVDVRSDIYSLGCTLYHMLTGEPPYPEGTVLQKLLDHQGKEPPDPAKKNQQVPPALSVIVRRMMAGDLQQRYSTPDELIHDLLLISGPMGLRAGNPDGLIWTGTPEPRQGFWEKHLGWMVTTAALILIVLFIGRFQQPPQTNGSGASTRDGVALTDASGNRDRMNAGDGQAGMTLQPGSKASGNDTESAGDEGPDKSNSSTIKIPNGTDGSVTSSPTTGSRIESVYHPHDPDAVVSGKTAGKLPVGDGSNTDHSTTTGKTPVALPLPAPRPTKAKGTPVAGSSGFSGSMTSRFPTAAAPALGTIVIVGGDETSSFPTLEGACRAARDNAIIELRYNGRHSGPVEKPIRIENKKITIRAGKDAEGNLYRPLIVFAPSRDAASASQMISLTGGSVELFNLDILLTIPDDLELDGADRWSLLSLHGSEQVVLQGVTVTVLNGHIRAGSQSVSIVELADGHGQNLPAATMMKMGQNEGPRKFRVRVSESSIRGRCDLFVAAHNQPGLFDVEKSVVAIHGSFLSLFGDLDMPDENSEVELLLDHVTCLTDGGLLRFDSGDQPRQLVPVQVTAANTIFLTAASTPLITMAGDTDAGDFRRLLRWNGSKNFYTGFRTFWSVESTAMTAKTQQFNFEQWKRFVGAETEADAHRGGIVWKRGVRWKSIRKERLVAADLQLDTTADSETNPAATGAADGTAVGADNTVLRFFPVLPESSGQ